MHINVEKSFEKEKYQTIQLQNIYSLDRILKKRLVFFANYKRKAIFLSLILIFLLSPVYNLQLKYHVLVTIVENEIPNLNIPNKPKQTNKQ